MASGKLFANIKLNKTYMFFYSTRTLGLPKKLRMLSVYLPFTNRQTGVLLSFGGNKNFGITLFSGFKFYDLLK